MKPFTASELMTSRLMTVNPSMGLRDLVDYLRDNSIHGALVKEGDRLVGVVSFTDLLVYLADEVSASEHSFSHAFLPDLDTEAYEEFAGLLDGANVNDVMTPAVFTCSTETTAGEAAGIMADKEVHRLVVTENGTAVGLLSATDLLKATTEYEEAATAAHSS
ncbi:MAG: CBS domain-containing protein [Planctomycetota bacterium]|jgi:CBS domain-containing protein|nr:CBS domain-containing protein [Planctomycetota bacterium]MDP6941666.1 CBS domain-containing protein [Planctomycetota bacterium]